MSEPVESTAPSFASDLPPGPWLVFSAHADDESIGMGGTLLLGAQSGIRIRWVILTDGARGGAVDAVDPQLARVRREEARAVASELGISGPEFWDEPDSGLEASASAVDRVAALVREVAGGTVFFPSRLDFHRDHRAAALLVWNGILASGVGVEAWAYGVGAASPANRLVSVTGVLEQRRKLIGSYASQLAVRRYDDIADSLSLVRGYTLGTPGGHAEAFFAYRGRGATTLTSELIDGVNRMLVPDLVTETPLVSVIVRTRNRPQSLARALQSVASQTYRRIQLIVVNDGGVDIAGVAAGYRASVERLDLLSLERNRGRAGAANAGLDASVGEWISFLDDDDLWEPDHLENLLRVTRANPGVRAAYTGAKVDGPDGVHIEDNVYSRARLQLFNLFPIHAAVFAREFLALGCRFDEGLEIFEDHDFWIQITEQTDWLRVPGCSAIYHPGGTSGVHQSGLDLERCRRARERMEARWYARWSRKDLEAQAILGRSMYRSIEDHFLNAKRELGPVRRQLEAKIHEQQFELAGLRRQVDELAQREQAANRAREALVGSRSYRLGRWLTGPWRCLLGVVGGRQKDVGGER